MEVLKETKTFLRYCGLDFNGNRSFASKVLRYSASFLLTILMLSLIWFSLAFMIYDMIIYDLSLIVATIIQITAPIGNFGPYIWFQFKLLHLKSAFELLERTVNSRFLLFKNDQIYDEAAKEAKLLGKWPVLCLYRTYTIIYFIATIFCLARDLLRDDIDPDKWFYINNLR